MTVRIPLSIEAHLLTRLQQGIPLVARPFAAIASEVGVREDAVLGLLREALADGRARRFGAVFDPARLGYRSTLAAVQVAPAALEKTAAALRDCPGVTHAYSREPLTPCEHGAPLPNFWFTLLAPVGEFDATWLEVQRKIAPAIPVSLPALRRFKIWAVFPDQMATGQSAVPACPPVPKSSCIALEEAGWRMIGRIQDSLPVVSRPFALLAEQCDLSEATVLHHLTQWQAYGLLRRLAMVAHHRHLGYCANALTLWQVPSAHVLCAGERLAARPEVTHCYERRPESAVPDNLYAMLHARSQPELVACFHAAQTAAGLRNGCLLASGKEYIKTSLRYASALPAIPPLP